MSVVLRVARGEGWGAVGRRIAGRVDERLRLEAKLARGWFASPGPIPILNVLGTPPAARLGGMQIQLAARLREERALRDVALFHPGVLEAGSRAWPREAWPDARATIVEGTDGIPLERLLRRENVVLVLHDLLLQQDPLAPELLRHARAVIYPSAYLRDQYGVAGPVIEPGVTARKVQAGGDAIAFAGSVRRDKGGHLLPDLIAAVPGRRWHIFGGGREELLRPLRRLPGVTVHGYYRAGTLPSLLARHGVGLAVLPSVVPETYSLTLSECWCAGVPVVAFDRGAHAERIRREGGGWLGDDLAAIVRRWIAGELTTQIPANVATPRQAAEAHVALYRQLGLMD